MNAPTNNDNLIEVTDLNVEYGSGKEAFRAVAGVSFSVRRGDCVGFIGANGAGKSTTMKAMMGFMYPKSGSVKLFGKLAGDTESRRRLGYLPEVTLYYPFMKAKELLFLYGGLQGMSRSQLRERIPQVLGEVGLTGKGESLLKTFSKGMQQRLGIAQAIIADPELLILDELSSGLDPLGRHDLRELMLKLKKAGRTIFFSSHELSEVETLCDRVIMIHKGRVVAESAVADLLKPLNIFEIRYSLATSSNVAELAGAKSHDGNHTITLHGAEDFNAALSAILSHGGNVLETKTATRTLEQYFIDLVRNTEARQP